MLYARTEFVKRESTQKGWGDHRGAFVAAMNSDSRITVNALACWCSLTTGVRVRQLSAAPDGGTTDAPAAGVSLAGGGSESLLGLPSKYVAQLSSNIEYKQRFDRNWKTDGYPGDGLHSRLGAGEG